MIIVRHANSFIRSSLAIFCNLHTVLGIFCMLLHGLKSRRSPTHFHRPTLIVCRPSRRFHRMMMQFNRTPVRLTKKRMMKRPKSSQTQLYQIPMARILAQVPTLTPIRTRRSQLLPTIKENQIPTTYFARRGKSVRTTKIAGTGVSRLANEFAKTIKLGVNGQNGAIVRTKVYVLPTKRVQRNKSAKVVVRKNDPPLARIRVNGAHGAIGVTAKQPRFARPEAPRSIR